MSQTCSGETRNATGAGLTAASQLPMVNVIHEIQRAERPVRVCSRRLTEAPPRADRLALVAGGGATPWIAAGLTAVSMGFVLSRVIEEI